MTAVAHGPTCSNRLSVGDVSGDGIAVAVRGISKSYGSTKAVRNVSMTVGTAEALGIVGHNGAGKTTLMKMLAGLTLADEGTISFGATEMPRGFDVMDARAVGFRLASQEITLCPDLRIFENVALAHPALASNGARWRAGAKGQFRERLEEIFPDRTIPPQAVVERLSLSERQMVQLTIALLPGASPIKCVVLDEPTSALSSDVANDLFRFLRTLRKNTGAAVVIISHKIQDIAENVDRVLVMKDGTIVKELGAHRLQPRDIIDAMGGSQEFQEDSRLVEVDRALSLPIHENGVAAAVREEKPVRVAGPAFTVAAGEVVGLAGLEGQGQSMALQAVWQASRHKWRGRLPGKRWKAWRVTPGTRVAYVSGDRQQYGLFPQWSVRENLSIGALGRIRFAGLLSRRMEKALTDRWIQEMEIRASAGQWIMELSGGSQQKVLLARGLASDPDVILLDDPFRGVDIMTRRNSYLWLHEEAKKGVAILWYSSEGEEMRDCDRVYVFNGGEVVAELGLGEISEEQIIKHSFSKSRAVATR